MGLDVVDLVLVGVFLGLVTACAVHVIKIDAKTKDYCTQITSRDGGVSVECP